MSRRRGYKMVLVVERFTEIKQYDGREFKLPAERLSCGHVRRDPFHSYGNETAVKIRRAFQMLMPNEPIRARCYLCAAPVVKPISLAEALNQKKRPL